jgi:hypothetical protein
MGAAQHCPPVPSAYLLPAAAPTRSLPVCAAMARSLPRAHSSTNMPCPLLPTASPQVHMGKHNGVKFDCTEEGCGKSFTEKSALAVSIARMQLPACLARSHRLQMGERRVRQPPWRAAATRFPALP